MCRRCHLFHPAVLSPHAPSPILIHCLADEEDGDVPQVPLEELLDDLAALGLSGECSRCTGVVACALQLAWSLGSCLRIWTCVVACRVCVLAPACSLLPARHPTTRRAEGEEDGAGGDDGSEDMME